MVVRGWWMVAFALVLTCPWVGHAQERAALDPGPAPLLVSGQMLEVRGRLSLRVRDGEDALKQVEALLPSLGGRIRDRDGWTVSIEVPRGRFEDAVDSVKVVGMELDRSVEVRDRSSEYLDTLALLRSAEQSRERLARLLVGLSNVTESLQVEDALSQWDEQVAEWKRSSERIQHATQMAVLTVALRPVYGVVREEFPEFRLPFPWLDRVGPERLMDLDSRGSDAGPAEGGISSSAQMDLHLLLLRAADEGLLGENRTATAVGFGMRGVGETTPVGFAAGMDLELGGGLSGGFYYEYRMLVGLGSALGKHVSFGVVTGLGVGGLTGGHIPIGFEVPVEAFGAVELGAHLRAGGWARSSWIFGSDARQDGADRAPFGDELSTGMSLLLGARDEYRTDRTGVALRGGYRELMGTHGYEVSLGYAGSFLEFERAY